MSDDWELKFKQAIIGDALEVPKSNSESGVDVRSLFSAFVLSGTVPGGRLDDVRNWLADNPNELKRLHQIIDSYNLKTEEELQLAFSIAIDVAYQVRNNN